MSKAYGLIYNSYWNREIKKKNTIAEYVEDLSKVRFTADGINFYPRDGIRATLKNVSAYDDADYVVITDDNGNIQSRWFIMENMNVSYDFYDLQLKRDVIADDLAGILDSTFYIEKGTIPTTDPFIYNPEKTSPYNQIKTKEILLKDAGRCKWLVAFISKKRAGSAEARTFKAKLNANPEYSVAGISNWEYYKYVDKSNYSNVDAVYITSALSTVNASGPPYGRYNYLTKINEVSCFSVSREYSKALTYTQLRYGLTYQPSTTEVELAFDRNNQFQQALNNVNFDSTVDQNTIQNLDGKYIKDTTDGKIYKIKVEYEPGQVFDESIPKNSAFFNSLKSLWTSFLDVVYFDDGDNPFSAQYVGTRFKMTLTETEGVSVEYTLPETTNEYGLTDQPFDIICTPYEPESLDGSEPGFSKGVGTYKFALDAALPLFSAIAQDALCYDLQLLPYTITGDAVTLRNTVNYQIKFESTAHVELVDAGSKKIPIWWPSVSSFRNIIQLANDDRVYITEPKVQSECDLYRFSSPNYGSSFDFNAAMNGGLFSVEVNCTYLPYQSYIHINPSWGGLYGKDFDDSRGLICGGNYSLSATTDAWRNYVTQNKNYNEIFQAGIENLKAEREIQRVEQITAGTVGALGSAITSGGIVGGLAGIGVGLAAGVASAVGAGIDYSNSEKRFNQNIKYQTQMQNYQLGNIKARPTSLSKTSSYNVDNKYWPVLEYYTCTEEEKQALRDQIKYTGMTVMRTGTLRDYLGGFVKGKLIRTSSTLNNDADYISVIAEELDKGVYIYNEEGGEAN